MYRVCFLSFFYGYARLLGRGDGEFGGEGDEVFGGGEDDLVVAGHEDEAVGGGGGVEVAYPGAAVAFEEEEGSCRGVGGLGEGQLAGDGNLEGGGEAGEELDALDAGGRGGQHLDVVLSRQQGGLLAEAEEDDGLALTLSPHQYGEVAGRP